MTTNVTQKEQEATTWQETAKSQLDDFSDYNRSTPQNLMRTAIKALAKSMGYYDEHFSKWKHSIEPAEMRDLEKISKRVQSLHTKLELEYNSK